MEIEDESKIESKIEIEDEIVVLQGCFLGIGWHRLASVGIGGHKLARCLRALDPDPPSQPTFWKGLTLLRPIQKRFMHWRQTALQSAFVLSKQRNNGETMAGHLWWFSNALGHVCKS